ncbi:MAG: hypothetical protein ACRC1U_04415 [Vibrionaceae bacterium]
MFAVFAAPTIAGVNVALVALCAVVVVATAWLVPAAVVEVGGC